MQKVFNYMGGRKTFFGLVLMVTMVVFVVIDKATVNDYTEFMKWIFLTYVGGNGVSHIAKAFNKTGDDAKKG